MRLRNAFWAMILLVAVAGCMSVPRNGSNDTHQPLKRVDAARFYTGTWLEIGRRPMYITDGCVAGTTSYSPGPGNSITVTDACRQGGVNGRLRSITGKGTLLDPGTDAKLHVRYNALISRTYWIIDHDAGYSWFIEASPDFADLWIFTRHVPSSPELKRLVARAAALGYDTSKLEFPAQPPGR